MAGTRYLCHEIGGTLVVAAPAEVDITSAAELHAVLLDAISRRPPTVVLDMTRTRFCDSAAVNAMLRAHMRARIEGGELHLVVPADGPVPHMPIGAGDGNEPRPGTLADRRLL
jgi:anti-anti-sigma factor